jgi:hypothetical protein
VTQVEFAGLETYAAIEQFRSLPSWIAQLGRPAARSNKVQHTQQPEVLINHGHVSFSWSVTFHFKKLIKLASGSVSSSLCRYYLHYIPPLRQDPAPEHGTVPRTSRRQNWHSERRIMSTTSTYPRRFIGIVWCIMGIHDQAGARGHLVRVVTDTSIVPPWHAQSTMLCVSSHPLLGSSTTRNKSETSELPSTAICPSRNLRYRNTSSSFN